MKKSDIIKLIKKYGDNLTLGELLQEVSSKSYKKHLNKEQLKKLKKGSKLILKIQDPKKGNIEEIVEITKVSKNYLYTDFNDFLYSEFNEDGVCFDDYDGAVLKFYNIKN